MVIFCEKGRFSVLLAISSRRAYFVSQKRFGHDSRMGLCMCVRERDEIDSLGLDAAKMLLPVL
jgi:hypothetical protein